MLHKKKTFYGGFYYYEVPDSAPAACTAVVGVHSLGVGHKYFCEAFPLKLNGVIVFRHILHQSF